MFDRDLYKDLPDTYVERPIQLRLTIPKHVLNETGLRLLKHQTQQTLIFVNEFDPVRDDVDKFVQRLADVLKDLVA